MGELQRQSGVEGCDTAPPGTATSGYPTSGPVFTLNFRRKKNSPSVTDVYLEKKTFYVFNTVLWIRDILVKIRIRGSLQLTYGSCCFFSSVTFKVPTINVLLIIRVQR
jgi:hypothetical protein